MNNIPETINNFNVYKEGTQLIGVSDEVTIPDFEAMSETISGPGILGEYDCINPGHFGSQDLEVPFRVMYGDIYKLINPNEAVDLTLRGSIQITEGSGNKAFKGLRVVVRGSCKSITGGSLKAGSPMSSSVKIGLTYILVEVDGTAEIELDKLNNVFKIGGNDILAAIKSLC